MRYIFKQGEGYPASKMSFGGGLKSLEEDAELKNIMANTPNGEMDLQANTGPLLDIRFLEGGGRRYAEDQ